MKILILGGGFQQLPAIRKAHELGLTVLLADYLPDAPGRREVDQSFLISTRDKDKILDLARKEDVDGILAFASDPAEETAAYVAEKIGLPGGMYAAAGILGNKRKFREFLAMHRIPAPRHFPMDYPESDLPYPVVVKPLDSSGSKGVTILRSYDAGRLLRAYQTAVSCSLSGQAMAEEYISYGYRHLIGGDVIVRGGNVILYGLMDCIREKGKNLVPCDKIYPCGAGDEVKARIARIMQTVIHKLSITDTEMNVEFIAGKAGNVMPSKGKTIFDLETMIRGGGEFLATNTLFFRKTLLDNPPEFRNMCSYDYVLQVAGAMRGGVLYLPELMLFYRIAVPGSWTQRIGNGEYYVLQAELLKKMLDMLNIETERKYEQVIVEKKEN